MYDVTKDELEARFLLIKAIRELIIREYADYLYEKDVTLYEHQLREANDSIRVRVEKARSKNSSLLARILQSLRILPRPSEDAKDYEYLKPEIPAKSSYFYEEEFEKQEAFEATAIQINATIREWDSEIAHLPLGVSTFDRDIEFAFDFAIRHYDANKNRRSGLSNPVCSLHTLATFVKCVVSIDLPSASCIFRNAYDVIDYQDKMRFYQRVLKNAVPKLEKVGVECFPFVSSLELLNRELSVNTDLTQI